MTIPVRQTFTKTDTFCTFDHLEPVTLGIWVDFKIKNVIELTWYNWLLYSNGSDAIFSSPIKLENSLKSYFFSSLLLV